MSLLTVPVSADMYFDPVPSEEIVLEEQPGNTADDDFSVLAPDEEFEVSLPDAQEQDTLFVSGADKDRIKFIVMTGGTYQWQLESSYLCDPYQKGISVDEQTGAFFISAEYNQLWEAKGIDAAEDPGKMVLLDADGIIGDGESACRSEDELMTEPETLKRFINYAATSFPAKKYDLILWDHGMGPEGGFGGDEHDGSGGKYSMTFIDLLDVFSDNEVTRNGGKFDFVDFDACLMSSLELILPFSEYMDCYIASPELEPGYGQYYGPCEGVYRGWLDAAGEDPNMDAFEIGRIMVDDYVAFYDKAEGDGSTQEGTLSVINLDKLLNYHGIISYLNTLFSIMKNQLTVQNGKGLYPFYDELCCCSDAIQYGKNNYMYYDLGCFLSKLAMEYREIEPEDIIDDVEIDYANNYMEVTASLNAVLHNEETVYARGTKGIRSVPQYYRDEYGRVVYGQLPTNGIYISFLPPDLYSSFIRYALSINELIDVLPDGKIKEYFRQYLSVLTDYCMIVTMGHQVASMTYEGIEKSEVNIGTVQEHMQDPDLIFLNPETGEVIDISDWGAQVAPLLQFYDDQEALFAWLDGIVKQQAEEAITKKNIRVIPVSSESGLGYEVKIADTRKRLIDRVQANVIAELPAYIEYLNDPKNKAVADMLLWMTNGTEFPIGTIDGKEIYDTGDPSRITPREYLEWYMDPNSSWELEPFEEKWYAVQDAEGNFHAVSPTVSEEEDEIYFMVMYLDDEGNENLAYLDFIGGTLNEIYFFTDNGGYRSILAKDLTDELTVIPIRRLQYFIAFYANVPMSLDWFTITAENADQIKVSYTDISNIPDIADTDGDGDALTRQIVITDIYGYQTDISDLICGPEAESIQLNKTSADLAAGKTLQLTATVLPSNAVDGKVTWSSSDPNIASVDQKGLVKAKKYGKAIITAVTEGGLSASCKIQTRFKDVTNPKSSIFDAVYWAVDKGITKCTVTFKPDDTVTRGELAAFIWRLAGQKKSNAETKFKDVTSSTKYYSAIRWCVEKGIIKGYKDGTFRPEDPVTRGETATMLWRYAGRPEPKTTQSPFSDIKPSSADSYKAILWGSEKGIMKGTAGKFKKNSGCTRGQTVTFLYRYSK